eukprot:c25488_g1_i1 orf=16-183(-)
MKEYHLGLIYKHMQSQLICIMRTARNIAGLSTKIIDVLAMHRIISLILFQIINQG